MNKALFLWPLMALAFVCCNKKRPLPGDEFALNQVSVLIDDQLWNGEIGDSLRNKLASPVLGLPQEEPLFTIHQYPVKLLEGYMTNCRNIIVVKKTDTTSFRIRENEYMTPQNVIYICGTTTSDILRLIEQNASQMVQKIRASEIREAQLHLRRSLPNDKVVRQKFGVAIDVPSDFSIVVQRQKFLWFKREITSGSVSLVLYQLPERVLGERPKVGRIIEIRDSIGRQYIHGTKPMADMMTENSYAPYFSSVRINRKPAFETRGTWQLKNDFMSGPFLNYCIYDRQRRVYLFAEGFCYAPSREKRELMFELEAILKTLRFVGTNPD